MTQNISYIQTVQLLRSFAERHSQINSFYTGDIDEFGNGETIIYPVLGVFEIDSTMVKVNQSYQQIEYKFHIICGDILLDGHSNQDEIRSDTKLILQDMVTEFNTAPYYRNNNIVMIGDVRMEPFTEKFDDLITGNRFELTLRVPYRASICTSPIEPPTGNTLTTICNNI